MRLSVFLNSRLPNYLIRLAALALAILFLYIFHLPWRGIVIATVIVIAGAVLSELLDFFQKKRFYDTLLERLDELDQAYLVSEMVEPPDFYDGQLLCDVLHTTSRSMVERIGEYRRESAAFRDYIELWVHEIKLPVASLQLMCHNDGNTRYVKQLSRIDDMIQNVLYYARSENAEKDYVIREVSLKRAFTDVALRYRDEILERGIQIVTDGLDTSVMTDGKWLSYMLGQLMANSIKYTSPDGEMQICVSAEELPDRTILHFWDNGIGIPPSDLPHIFDKSFTGENGRTGANSTGMGLYLVKKLCDKLGHTVSAESVPGEFTDIRISFGKSDLSEVL